MTDSVYLKRRRAKYISCLNSVVATANNLSMSIKILNSTIDTQKLSYKIDDMSADGSHLSRLKAKQEKIYSNIVNNIIPGVKSIIRDLDYQIKDAIMREEMDD